MKTRRKKAKRRITAEQRRAGDEYKRRIETVGLSQRHAARFIGVNERTSRRYASGEWPVPRATAILLGLMAERRITPKKAEKIALGI